MILSADTLAKQLIRNPDLGLADYRRLQKIYRDAQLVVKDSDRTLAFYYKTDREFYTVVKATLEKDELYLTTFRRAEQQSVDNIRNKGEIIKDELK